MPKHTPAFSQRHYKILAQAIAESREYVCKKNTKYRAGAIKLSDALIMNLVRKFTRDNPRFKDTLFITAAVSAPKRTK